MKARISTMISRASRPTVVHVSVMTRVVLGVFLLSGCVTEGRYEEAVTAHAVEQKAHATTREDLRTARLELERISKKLEESERVVAFEEERSAELLTEVVRLEAARAEEAELVAQLQAELERVGDHLRVFATEKDYLALENLRALDELGATKAELGRLSAQVEALLFESQEKVELRKQLDRALERMTRLEQESVEQAAKKIKAKKSS